MFLLPTLVQNIHDFGFFFFFRLTSQIVLNRALHDRRERVLILPKSRPLTKVIFNNAIPIKLRVQFNSNSIEFTVHIISSFETHAQTLKIICTTSGSTAATFVNLQHSPSYETREKQRHFSRPYGLCRIQRFLLIIILYLSKVCSLFEQ